MSLYPDDMTKKEVAEEFARLIEPTIRKMYEEYEKKEKEKNATIKNKKDNETKNPQSW